MRVWLVEDRPGDDPDGLESILNQLANQPENGLSLLVVRPGWSEFVTELRSLRPDVLVVRDAAWLDGPWTVDVLNLGPALVVVGSPLRCERLRALAEEHPILFLPARPSSDGVWLALTAATACQRREVQFKSQLARVQQRLEDRIVIERAKGILMKKVQLDEHDAFRQLQRLASEKNLKLVEIARIILTAEEAFESPTG